MSLRRGFIDQALASFSGLRRLLPKLTEEEVLFCLELEAGTLRRQSVIDRLISRAASLRASTYSRQLKEKFHGTSYLENHERR
jgi:hypothetical protein